MGALVAIPAVATLQAFLGAYVKRYEVTDDPRVHGHRHRGGRTLRRMRDVLGKKRDAPGAGKNAPAEAAHEAERPEGAAREGEPPAGPPAAGGPAAPGPHGEPGAGPGTDDPDRPA